MQVGVTIQTHDGTVRKVLAKFSIFDQPWITRGYHSTSEQDLDRTRGIEVQVVHDPVGQVLLFPLTPPSSFQKRRVGL
jgi:hypothetical protein